MFERPAYLLQGVCDVQLGPRLELRGQLFHHALQRPRCPAIPEAHPPHQEQPQPTVEGTAAALRSAGRVYSCPLTFSLRVIFPR